MLIFFFFNDTATTEIYTLSLHDALPICHYHSSEGLEGDSVWGTRGRWTMLTGVVQGEPVTLAILDHPTNVGFPTYWHARGDRKSTRLNSSHSQISYAVFCLKKKQPQASPHRPPPAPRPRLRCPDRVHCSATPNSELHLCPSSVISSSLCLTHIHYNQVGHPL